MAAQQDQEQQWHSSWGEAEADGSWQQWEHGSGSQRSDSSGWVPQMQPSEPKYAPKTKCAPKPKWAPKPKSGHDPKTECAPNPKSGHTGEGFTKDWSHKKRQLEFMMKKDFAQQLKDREAELRAEFEVSQQAALAEQEKRLVGEFDQEMKVALTAVESRFRKEADAVKMKTEQLLEASTRNVQDSVNKVQAAYDLYEEMFLKHHNLEKDMTKMAADHEETLLNKEAEFQLEHTKQAALHAKALQELHDTHVAAMKANEKLKGKMVEVQTENHRKKKQVAAMMQQITEVNEFVVGYHKKHHLDKYKRPSEDRSMNMMSYFSKCFLNLPHHICA